MGLGGVSPWSLVLILLIVLLLFGTKKLRNIGGDLGGALKNFKKAMSDDEKEQTALEQDKKQNSNPSELNTTQEKQQEKP